MADFVVRILLIFFAIFPPATLVSQEITYSVLFGKNWNEARQFMKENESWMRNLCSDYRVDYELAASVVFPEVVRFSAVRNKIEVTLLKSLYRYKGSEFADFSIGVFQMKPSCAGTVVNLLLKRGDRELKNHFRQKFFSLNGEEARALIISDMEEPERQFVYVLGLIRILEAKYRYLKWNEPAGKIRFFAAAYNGGFTAGEARIRQWMEERMFYTTVLKPDQCYSYAGVAEAWYREQSGNVRSTEKP